MTTTPSFNETETVEEAMRLRSLGVSIIGVGIGRSVSRSELDGVVSYPVVRNAFYVASYTHLSRFVSNIVNSQCNGMPPTSLLTGRSLAGSGVLCRHLL